MIANQVTDVRLTPLREDGTVDADAEPIVFQGVLDVRWGRRHKDPATRRRVRAVGARPTGYVLRDGLEDIGFDIELDTISAELLALLGVYTHTLSTHQVITKTTRAFEALASKLRREPWLIRLGQRLCGAR